MFNPLVTVLTDYPLQWRPEEQEQENKYILLDVLVCSIAVYFYEFCRILTSP